MTKLKKRNEFSLINETLVMGGEVCVRKPVKETNRSCCNSNCALENTHPTFCNTTLDTGCDNAIFVARQPDRVEQSLEGGYLPDERPIVGGRRLLRRWPDTHAKVNH